MLLNDMIDFEFNISDMVDVRYILCVVGCTTVQLYIVQVHIVLIFEYIFIYVYLFFLIAPDNGIVRGRCCVTRMVHFITLMKM